MPPTSTFLDALFANRCVLCRRMGSSCCADCWGELEFRQRPVIRQNDAGKTLRGVSAIDFDPHIARLIHEFKESNRTALAKHFAGAMAQALSRSVSAAPAEIGLRGGDRVYLVAVPSRLSSIQKRGFSPASLLSSALIDELAPRWGARRVLVDGHFVSRPLWLWRALESADQAELGQLERTQNLVGTMRASSRARGSRVILVDDIVTTGSSLFESARALEAEGAQVIGFVTFAETILRKSQK